MSLASYVLAAIATLPTFHEDVGEELVSQKRAQAETIASAISQAVDKTPNWPGSKRDLAALMLTVAWHETRLSLRIHDGRCKPYECDHGRARGLWQLQSHASLPRERWMMVAGLDQQSTLNAATEAALALSRSRHMCSKRARAGGDWVSLTILAYAGHGCGGTLPDITARVKTFRRLSSLQPKPAA